MGQGESQDYELKAGDAIARFSCMGAECRVWTVGGRRMTWGGDASVWSGVAPVLFPVCGWSRDGKISVGDTIYPMPVHGFAAQSVFSASQTSEDELRFTLVADDVTRGHYPFDFKLDVVYRLSESTLDVALHVENIGTGAMPYACGMHPGFTWEGGPSQVVFQALECAHVPLIAPGGLFSADTRPVPLRGRRLALSSDLFAAEALCFLDVASRRLSFDCPDGRLDVHAPDFPHLVLWSRDAAPFLAIESWTGTGDLDGFEGDFFERPSMIHLQPGARGVHRVSYAWHPSAPLAEAPNSA
ncbi:MAG: aldose 1-epimerase [Hyphomicrobiales bacterium]|nr:aldose 1-epimerase [Hyphomicrobiales bacterium]